MWPRNLPAHFFGAGKPTVSANFIVYLYGQGSQRYKQRK